MIKHLLLLFMLFLSNLLMAQVSSVNVNPTAFDSAFVIQSGTVDSFHQGNHPGAGGYSNARILICAGATLKYNCFMGTSNQPTFFLEPNATLITYSPFMATLYMKQGSLFNANGYDVYPNIKRVSSANYINQTTNSNIMDSVFTAVNFTFNGWAGNTNPCGPTGIEEIHAGRSGFVYPNPSSKEINFRADVVSICIYSLQGQKVLDHNVSTRKISIAKLPTGIYMGVFRTAEGEKIVQRILKD